MKRRLRFWSIVLLAPLALVAVVVAWLLASGSGARFAVARAIAASGGKLTVAQIHGTLAGPLTLRDLRYRDTGVDVHIGLVVLDIAPRALVSRTLHVRDIAVTDLTVTLVTQPPTTTPKPFSLAPPIAIVVDRLRVDRAGLVQDGAAKLPVDSVDLVGAWTADGLTIGRFALRAPDGEVTLDGKLTSYDLYTGDSRGTFRWNIDGTAYAGTLGVTSDGKHAGVQLVLREPTAATVQAQLQNDTRWPWTIAVQVPAFDPKRIAPDSTLESFAANLRGSGDRTAGTLTGDVAVNAHTITLDPFRFAVTKALLRIDALTLRSPDAPGHLDASGTIDFATTPPLTNLDVAWDGVELPADLAGQTLHSRGTLKLSGNAAKYAANGAFALGPPGKLVDVTIDAVSVADTITLNRLALVQQRGKLEATGEVVLRPHVGWTVDAVATNFDPGALFAAWPGSVSAQLHSTGTRDAAGVHATLKLDRLAGRLRERRLAGHADLRIEPGQVVDGTMELQSGASSLTLRGRGGSATDATITFDVASLGDLLPAAQGSARGEFTLKGRWPALAVNGRLDGRAIVLDDIRAETVHLDVALRDASAPSGSIDLSAADATIAGVPFARVTAHGEGDRNAHVLRIDADGKQLGVDVTLRGSNAAAQWSGTLTQLRLDAHAHGVWELRRPVALAFDARSASIGELCLANAPAQLCVEGDSAHDGSARARYTIESVPLAMIMSLVAAESTLRVDGSLDGSGDVRRAPGGELAGTATVTSANGRVAYPDTGERPLLDYTGATVAAQMRGSEQQLTVHATLADGGSIDGDIRASGADHRLAGQVSIRMTNLGIVELLTTELAAVKGQLAGALRVEGTLAAPEFSGDIRVDGLSTEVPRAGLKLHDGTLRIGALGADRYTVEGRIRSGDGEVTISGSGGGSTDAPLRAQLRGENFLAVDIPAARVVVSPQLTLERTPEKLLVGGSLAIPSADVDLDKMPGGGAAKTSPDVVVTDAPVRETKNALPIQADVTVSLGDEVKLKGFGFDGKLAGQLVVIDRPGRQTIGRGEIRASGTYKAYGQNLKIETGRVLFAGTAIDNPGLDLRAVRELKDVTAGLRVQGTAQVPVLTVYAEPAMEQSEALSYLITGRPLSSLNNSEGSLVGAAAQALGSATGDLLAKSVGARLGVEASVSDSTALGGSAFTVGKYLSPKVYVSYGVGLFTPGEVITLRYILSKRWELEVQNATTENRAGINYRYEK